MLVDDLDRAINTYNVDPVGNSVLPVTQAMDELNGKLFSLSDSPVVGAGGLGMVVAIPSEDFGLAFSASATVSGVGFFTYKDGQTVTDFAADVTTLDSCLPTCSPLDFNNLNNIHFL